MNTFLRFAGASAIGLAAIAGSAAPVSAAIQNTATQSVSFGPTQTDVTFAGLNFNKFNLVGATLNSVHLTLTGTLNSSENTVTCFVGGTGGVCDYVQTLSINMLLSAPGPVSLFAVLPTSTFSNTFLPQTFFDVIAPATTSASDSRVYCILASAGCTDFSPLIVGLFNGAGTIALSAFADGITSITNNNGSAAGSAVSLLASGTATLFYDYEDNVVTTPEPASMALLGAGLLALGAARRRRRG